MPQRENQFMKKPPSRIDDATGTLAWLGYGSLEEVKAISYATAEMRDFMERCGWNFERKKDGTNG